MKIGKICTLGLLTTFLYSSVVSAQGWVVTGRPAAGGVAGSVTNSTPSQPDGVRINPTAPTQCNTDGYMPMAMLQNLLIDGSGFQFRYYDDERKLKVEVPPYYGNCMDLKFEFELKANQLYVKAKNGMSNPGEGSSYQKYVNCLKQGENPVITESNGQVNFHADRAKLKNAQFMELNIEGEEFDMNKDLKVHFLSPTPSIENGSFPSAFGTASPHNHCYKKETINKSKEYVAYLSPESRVNRTVYEACNSNEYKKILSALRNLNPSEVGNYALLKKVLEQALMRTLENDAEKIYDELEALGKDFKMVEGKPSLDEEEASDLADDYVELMEKLNKDIINPYISRIEDLMKKRQGPPRPNRDQRKAIDKLIKEYNNKIQEYAKKTNKLGYKNVMAVLKYYGQTDQARMIEGFRLKSVAFGRVYKDGRTRDPRGERLTIKTANKLITDTLEKFDKRLGEWELEAASRRGDVAPMLAERRKHQALTKSRDERFKNDMEKIQDDYKSCVGWFHTQFKMQKCQQKAKRNQQRALRRRAYYNRQIGTSAEKYGRYSSYYGDYQRSVASQSEAGSGLLDPGGYYSEYDFGQDFVTPESYYNLSGDMGLTMGGPGSMQGMPGQFQNFGMGQFQNFGGGGMNYQMGGGYSPFGNNMIRGY